MRVNLLRLGLSVHMYAYLLSISVYFRLLQNCSALMSARVRVTESYSVYDVFCSDCVRAHDLQSRTPSTNTLTHTHTRRAWILFIHITCVAFYNYIYAIVRFMSFYPHATYILKVPIMTHFGFYNLRWKPY